ADIMIPDRLQSMIFKAMNKKPDQRYQSAQELLDDLRALQSGSLADTKPLRPALAITARARLRVPKWTIAACAVLLLAAGAFLFFSKSEKAVVDVNAEVKAQPEV